VSSKESEAAEVHDEANAPGGPDRRALMATLIGAAELPLRAAHHDTPWRPFGTIT